MKPNRFLFRSPHLFATTLRYGAPVLVGFAAIISGLDSSHAAIFGVGNTPAGGASGGSTPAPATSAPVATESARANVNAILSRTQQAVGAAKAMQDAARAAATADHAGANPLAPGQTLPTVPNGLAAGGLQIAPGATAGSPLWNGANLPVQSEAQGKTTVTVKQTTQQALLHWQTLNVGRDTTLTFDQTAGGADVAQWIAFNRISDPSGNPTQILGSIKAQGQVYLINANGVIFGGGSQVNARGLTVSTLPINETLVSNGLLNNPSNQFLFDGIGKGFIGDVTVQAGARLTTDVSADGNGGRVMLVGANVTNAGILSTAAGQTILAAGLQVGFAGHLSSDPSLRGLDAFVGAVVDPSSTVTAGRAVNTGIIEAARGSITLTGQNVRQEGILESTTSVALNGRIDLLADYGARANPNYSSDGTRGAPFLYQETGSVSLAAGSVTRILPEYNSSTTVIGSELALRSQVNLRGRSVHLGQDASVFAPNAAISVSAGKWVPLGFSPFASFISEGGQVYLDRGAAINASGTVGATASVSQNFITLVLRGSELAVAPLQRDGELRGQEITVDLSRSGTYNGREWIGTPLADVSGFAGLIERDVAQLTTAGGTINISAGESVILRSGSALDVSAGWTDFTGGLVSSTRLRTGGRLMDIADATPDLRYDGIASSTTTLTNAKWGTTQVFQNALAPAATRYQAGYLQGADAGKISISAPSMALDGSLVGTSIIGPNQLRSSPTTSRLPAAGTLSLTFQAQQLLGSTVLTSYPTRPAVVFGDLSRSLLPAPAAFALDATGEPVPLTAARSQSAVIDPKWFSTAGFGNLSISAPEGSIRLPENVTLSRFVGGSLDLKATNLEILGSIFAPGGSLSFTAYNISPYQSQLLTADSVLPDPIPGNGVFTLGANAVLSTAGLITDDRIASQSSATPALSLRGGNISIAAFEADVSRGRIDVSGGYLLSSAGRGTFGNGGTLTLQGGQDPLLFPVVGGSLKLGATLSGYSGARGGTLSLLAPHVRIGGSSTGGAETLHLQSPFFDQGGFATFNIAGLGGGADPAVQVMAGAKVSPIVSSFRSRAAAPGQPIGLEIVQEIEGIRQPVTLNLSAPGVRDLANEILIRGDVVVAQGSELRTDAGGSISVTGNTVSISGSLIAPGGTLHVAGGNSTASVFKDFTQALATTHLAAGSLLSTAGKVVIVPDPFNRRTGQVWEGGRITLGGNIAAASGAILDASGSSGELDLEASRAQVSPTIGSLTQGSGIFSVQRVKVDSDGGTIILQGGQMLFSDATLIARAGGSTALGGSLRVSSGRYEIPGLIPPVSDINLTVFQDGNMIQATPAAVGAALGNGGHFTVRSFLQGGFDSLALDGVVSFNGPVDLTARGELAVASNGFLYTQNEVRLFAAYAKLGTAFTLPTLPADVVSPFGSTPYAPTSGPGSLTVRARQIDLGNLSLQNTGNVSLIAENGEIRGSGVVHLVGNLLLRAGQIHPLTASPLSFIAYDTPTAAGSIRIEAADPRSLPLSAGGTLGLFASQIHQNGTLRAPFGTIQLGWDGTGTTPTDLLAGNLRAFPITRQLTLGSSSTTSVSGVDPITGKGIVIPYGVSTDGENWIDPRGLEITVSGPPEKSILLSAGNLTTEAGSRIDLRGGGDLQASRWVPGIGGLTDILASETSFAIIPGYGSAFAPYAAFNPSPSAANAIRGQSGYLNPALRPGDTLFVAGSKSLAAGNYTLLPARYALLPGAVLITPTGGTGTGTVEMPDRSSVVSGYRFNALNSQREIPTLASRFEIATVPVVFKRAEYQNLLGNTFFKSSITAPAAPRLALDAGRLIFQATQSMSLAGGVLSNSISGGRGSAIDISTPLDTFITRGNTAAPAGSITLTSQALNGFGAESLLIGGVRSSSPDGTRVTVRTGRITVDNAGAPLLASDLILAGHQTITLAPGAALATTGSLTGAENLLFSGDGALLRLSADAGARTTRTGVTLATSPELSVGAAAVLSGKTLVLDTSGALTLDPSAQLDSEAYAFSSRRISFALDATAALPADAGLVVSNKIFTAAAGAKALSFLSYSTLDVYGNGTFGNAAVDSLSLSAASIRGFNGGGSSTIQARNLTLQNTANAAPGTPATADSGSLLLDASVITLGANPLALSGFNETTLRATGGILGTGTGAFSTRGSLEIISPLVTGTAGAIRTLSATGALRFTHSPTAALVTGGLGSSLEVTASSIAAAGNISLASGSLRLRSTLGDLVVSGTLDVSGTRRSFYDVTKFTDAGSIRLTADQGAVNLTSGSLLQLASVPGGGDGGTLAVAASNGQFTAAGTILASGGVGGLGGRFELDTAALPDLTALRNTLAAADLTRSQTIRVRNGDVVIGGQGVTRSFSLSADRGSITVTGTIDSSGETGGTIHLTANGDLSIRSGARLTVAGRTFSSAGKGGSITLEAGTQREGVVGNGTIDLRSGSTLDLSVAETIAGDVSTPGSSAYFGRFGGKLHLRAPQAANDLRVGALGSAILGASSILVEGYRLYDFTSSGGTLTTTVQNSIRTDATALFGANGATTAAASAITTRLLAGNSSLAPLLVLAPGAEIINRTGNLTLGTSSSTTTSDWDLAGFRFGTKGAPGVLTLRAAGDVTFFNALSDGFTPTTPSSDPNSLWTARLSAYNPLLPANQQSWSYRITAGADLSASASGTLLPAAALAPGTGSIRIGKNATNLATGSGASATTASAVANRFQVVRTGSGDITARAAANVLLLNQFATLYTAGTRVPDATLGGTFRNPSLNLASMPSVLGSAQQSYAVQYSMAGGNVDVFARNNIERLTLVGGVLVPDSQLQMPTNWLYRRGSLDPVSGTFDIGRFGDSTSTTWWVDFSNFFQGIGALGGGDVSLEAGNRISNVDAVIPTNGRMPGYTDATQTTQTTQARPDASALVELGGGNLTVIAGTDLDAGVYYVERGLGTLTAGSTIRTNSTRSVLAQSNLDAGLGNEFNQLPTTLFLGKGGFKISARGDVLLGPVANPFLLPGGLLNSFWNKSYFSTYAQESFVDVSSLGGDIRLRTAATAPGQAAGIATPLLQSWYTNRFLFTSFSSSNRRPWLRLNESSVLPFETAFTLQPASLGLTSFSGDINLVGNLTLAPSPSGRLNLLAHRAIQALQPNGVVTLAGTRTTTWGRSRINLSDADPAALPGIANPFGFQSIAGISNPNTVGTTGNAFFLEFINRLFRESGGVLGENTVLQVKQALHAAGLLHRLDPEPTRLYASSGDISGLTLFSPKHTRVFAARDLSDLALYLQNVRSSDTSIVAAGRDLKPYDSLSPLRVSALTVGNIVNTDSTPQAGDIQINGPGALHVLAGRNLDLGTGPNNPDGTGTGITSIGNTRNPYLPFDGANLLVAAGLGPSAGLASSSLGLREFIADYVLTEQGTRYLKEIAPGVVFADQSAEEQARLAIEVFHRILRDAGRAFPETGNYDAAYQAIARLFGDPAGRQGNILTRARDVRTTNGGDISIIAPGGRLELANTTLGNPLSPPGIITASGGNISVFTHNDIRIGIGRIFTLRGGNEILWSSTGDIAAGSSSKTVKSAPPTRVLIDPQSAAVKTDLAGLATGGGIGVLATVAGVPAGDVDLIAPRGTVDAGDAGIRVSGNLNIAANQVLNAGNIAVGGASVGTPQAPSAPAVSTVTAAANTAAAAADNMPSAAPSASNGSAPAAGPTLDSIFSVVVIGYGGGDPEDEEKENAGEDPPVTP